MSLAMPELPNSVTLGPVSLRMSNLISSTAWLERVLGLAVMPTPSADAAVLGTRAGQPLVVLREVAGIRRVPPHGLFGLYHYAIRLPSRADLGRFMLHLVSLDEPFGSSDHAFSEALYLTDPDGITVEVYADRARERWTHRGEDVVATNLPLDVPGLAREAGASRLQGVPRQSVIGHLHFFIGDLSAAERFYVQGLGFGVSSRLFPGALFVAAGQYHHHVGLNAWAAASPVAGPGDAGLDEWSLLLPDVSQLDALAARLGGVGVMSERQGASLVATDPWNIRVRASVT